MSIPTAKVHYDFSGHVAVVTGTARGIGLEIANALAAAGATVHGFDISRTHDTSFCAGILDVRDAAAVSAAVSALPTPTLLVNNAGITRDRTLAKMSDTEWHDVLDVNLTGAFHMMRAIGPRMVAQRFGRIVNIASINGLRGKFGQSNYAASKAGLIGLTKSAAREFGRAGVTVNVVAPGMVFTEMARALPPEVLALAQREASVQSLAQVEDIASAVLFLLSEGARAMTGAVLRVDAGQYI